MFKDTKWKFHGPRGIEIESMIGGESTRGACCYYPHTRTRADTLTHMCIHSHTLVLLHTLVSEQFGNYWSTVPSGSAFAQVFSSNIDLWLQCGSSHPRICRAPATVPNSVWGAVEAKTMLPVVLHLEGEAGRQTPVDFTQCGKGYNQLLWRTLWELRGTGKTARRWNLSRLMKKLNQTKLSKTK